MNWYEIDVKKVEKALDCPDKQRLRSSVLDMKYGDYDYSEDARAATVSSLKSFLNKELSTIATNPPRLLICGANSGTEIEFCGGYHVTALDLSSAALRKLRRRYPHVKTIIADMNSLPFKSNSFDTYLALRCLQSTYVDLQKSLTEAIRVLKPDGKLVLSIANAYLVEGKIIHGLYNTKTKRFDEQKPHNIAQSTMRILKQNGFKVRQEDIMSELTVCAER